MRFVSQLLSHTLETLFGLLRDEHVLLSVQVPTRACAQRYYAPILHVKHKGEGGGWRFHCSFLRPPVICFAQITANVSAPRAMCPRYIYGTLFFISPARKPPTKFTIASPWSYTPFLRLVFAHSPSVAWEMKTRRRRACISPAIRRTLSI